MMMMMTMMMVTTTTKKTRMEIWIHLGKLLLANWF